MRRLGKASVFECHTVECVRARRCAEKLIQVLNMNQGFPHAPELRMGFGEIKSEVRSASVDFKSGCM